MSSSSTQAHILPSTFSVIPTISRESQSPIPIFTSSTSTTYNLHIINSFFATESRLFPFTSEKFAAVLTEFQPSAPLLHTAATTSNSQHSVASIAQKNLK
ncbi:hypothetical protein TNCV_1297501 [Trichonephila clavipes]|nr:hypothetical protein TNCV_1297501 [Trichonephila clavipes]